MASFETREEAVEYTRRVEALVRESVGPADLAEYLTAPSGYRLGVYADGTVSVGPDVGQEIAEDERPEVWCRCPGLGQLDMTWWREGWDCEGLDDEDVVRDCCENGDVSAELEDLIARLTEHIIFEG